MKKADLHVHSRHSAHPSEWFLQRLGTRESYTTPEEVYRSAKEAGMDFVTLTDHNQMDGVLELKARHPHDVFTGVEVTTYFPEDGCKVHVLVYGLTEEQFRQIEQIRSSIYELRDYIREQRLAHSVAHATFSINGRLALCHLERLLLLFDCFEGINGARPFGGNDSLCRVITSLTSDAIEELAAGHGIAPFSDTSWVKGLTGGSDDHSNLFIGRTYTQVPDARTPEEFVHQLVRKQCFSEGRHNVYQTFAFSIYRIAYEFSKTRSNAFSSSLVSSLNRMLFDGHSMGLRNRLALTRMRMRRTGGEADLSSLVMALMEDFGKLKGLTSEEKINRAYGHLADISDHLMGSILSGAGSALEEGDLARLARNISGLIPVVFMSLPFFTTVNVLYNARELLEEFEKRFGQQRERTSRRILWFTDTLTDLNGPSETIRKLAWLSHRDKLELVPVSCLLPGEHADDLPPQTVNLPPIWSFTPSFFSTYALRVPSVLHSLRLICERNPDEIIISTPGPVGLLALLAARLLHVRCTAIYHTDFSAQAQHIVGDDQVCKLVDDYVRWFYSLCDATKVPTREYVTMLGRRGYNTSGMSIFKRGIEGEVFAPRPTARAEVAERFGVSPGFTLLYAGRISREKDMDFLGQVYRSVSERHPDINLLLCGDGPYLEEFREVMRDCPRVHFLGRLPRTDLPLLYSAADLFVFPSTTDTFGMVVLEAQACGLPALVSDIGGPKEVIRPDETGFVARARDTTAWTERITDSVNMADRQPELWTELRIAARRHVLATFDWRAVLEDLFGLDADEAHEAIPDLDIAAEERLAHA